MATCSVAAAIARRLEAIVGCRKSGNLEWLAKHEAAVDRMLKEYLPSGSGLDAAVQLDNISTPERLVFNTSYHHMDDNGIYAGWTEHTVTCRASLPHGMLLYVSGRNRNDIKEYLHQVFLEALAKQIDEYELFLEDPAP